MYMCELKVLEFLVRCLIYWVELFGVSIWSGLIISDYISLCLM